MADRPGYPVARDEERLVFPKLGGEDKGNGGVERLLVEAFVRVEVNGGGGQDDGPC